MLNEKKDASTFIRHLRELIYVTSHDDLHAWKLNTTHTENGRHLQQLLLLSAGRGLLPPRGPPHPAGPWRSPHPTGVHAPLHPALRVPPDSRAALSAASGPGAQSTTDQVSQVLFKNTHVSAPDGSERPFHDSDSGPLRPLKTD